MNKLSWLIAGAAAAALYAYLHASQRTAARPIPVVDLAHKLQDAWADHHTVV